MIFVSSSCVRHKKIKDSIQELVEAGIKNIELSGGTEYYPDFVEDILRLQENHHLNLRCHNYFPPPQKHFVLNLASLNSEIHTMSMNHLKSAIDLSKKIGAKKFAFHAGFYLDIKVSEIGKKISLDNLQDKTESMQKFCDSFNILKEYAGSELDLYVENNVFSQTNYNTYDGNNFFMLTHFDEYLELKDKIEFKVLLDVAHLKVSCRSLGLNFEEQLGLFSAESDYLHISDNDSLHDQNHELKKNSKLIEQLKKYNLLNKDMTLEIYTGLKNIQESFDLIKGSAI